MAVVTRALATAAMSLVGFRIPWDVPFEAVGQALVLSTVVSWQWWWALATVCSGLLTRFLAPMFLAEERASISEPARSLLWQRCRNGWFSADTGHEAFCTWVCRFS